jgi:hypothetical protein
LLYKKYFSAENAQSKAEGISDRPPAKKAAAQARAAAFRVILPV